MMSVMYMQEREVRVSRQRKAESRERILDAAGRLFRRHGIDSVGVDAVMQAAGLTHGGFYGHFPSKEALAQQVCAEQLADSAARWERWREELGGSAALARIVEGYLGPSHIADCERGCVVPVLGSELARRPEMRPALTQALRSMAGTLAGCLPSRRRRAGERALAGLACMVGAVIMARISDDPAFSEAILAAARAELGVAAAD